MTDNVPPRIEQLASNIEEHFMSLVAPVIKKASLQLAQTMEDTRRTDKHLRFMEHYGSKPTSFSDVLRTPEEAEELFSKQQEVYDSMIKPMLDEARLRQFENTYNGEPISFKNGDIIRLAGNTAKIIEIRGGQVMLEIRVDDKTYIAYESLKNIVNSGEPTTSEYFFNKEKLDESNR